MGFKSKARKRRQVAAAAAGPEEKTVEEYVGEYVPMFVRDDLSGRRACVNLLAVDDAGYLYDF